ncbi:hypothetical protein ENUP19_0063G0026 [Entamoeba nuttalli]|uniref:Nucleotidyltransferase domain containing protein n=2 Tax=Entamoeba nuttalli TaxID=412467 RepID=K2HIH6_ENTNP|nr:nucleotidyltransferase domain containing protein [Entamoeba nuttalli P19]EKE42834.1 nucleotidyltransferase domain containing protein [Entamoeba nuttalli P19]|eukprot:XP_008854832.1 nucleotidyltransferase domain containing protein [Entamoeba nuttalli P19]
MAAWLNGTKKKECLTLDKEMKLFEEFIQLTPEEIRCRNYCVDKLKQLFENNIEHCEVQVYGSFVYGLSLPSSDVDIALLFPQLPSLSIGRKIRILKRVAQLCRTIKSIRVDDVITNAKIPIVKLTDLECALSIDISVDCDNGIVTTSYIKTLLTEFPLARTLSLFIKFLLFQNSLNEPYHGGLGSYAIILLVCTYLKNNPTEDCGIAITGFLNFYGSLFKMRMTAVSLISGYCKYRSEDDSESCPMIIDPCDELNNVGRTSFKFTTVQYIFKKTLIGINYQYKSPKEKYLPKRSRLSNVVAIAASTLVFRNAICQRFSEQGTPTLVHENRTVNDKSLQ